ncbi:MAG: polysaccharide biosynthesis/export family protein [Candidatus Electrothrix sp. Rat3]|nr:polysaccharide biosynthesis/export family protein [Candidatus Electrothrix rattekaaiensis]
MKNRACFCTGRGRAERLFLSFCFFFLVVALGGCGDPEINIQHADLKKSEAVEPMISAEYLVGVGDELEIMYYIDSGSESADYLIDTEDELLVEFDYYPKLNKEVKVRPDGFITLPRVGDVKAAGLRPRDLAEKITTLFEPFFTRPGATVDVVDFNVKVNNLKNAITTTTRGESKQVTVRPDGKVSLPYVHDVLAKNLTCRELSQALTKEYRKFVRNVSIATAVLQAHSNRAYVLGEVRRSNFYELAGPLTLTQLIASAGGFSEYANTHQIVLIRRTKDGHPTARLFDMNSIMGKGDMNSDPIIHQYDVVFVPRTKISQAALVMDAMSSLWNIIPARFSYSLGGKDVE